MPSLVGNGVGYFLFVDVESRKSAELISEEFTGDKSQLQWIGTVEASYDQLEDDAKELFKHNPLCAINLESFAKYWYKKDYSLHIAIKVM